MSKKNEKLEGICRDYQERQELERLNKQIRERCDKIEEAMWQQARHMEETRYQQKLKNEAVAKLVFTIVMAMPVTAAFLLMAYMGVFAWWLTSCLVGLVVGLCAFRSGYLWHEIKKN